MTTTREEVQSMKSRSGGVAKRIRTALRDRSGKSWTVRVGHGAPAGWIHILAPTAELRAELSSLLNDTVSEDRVRIPATLHFYVEYLDRAEGREPSALGGVMGRI